MPNAESPTPWALALGDAKDIAAQLPQDAFQLIYVDPPFFTGRRQTGPEGEFEDSFAGGLEGYIAWLEERLAALRPLLTEDGALLLHLDWRAVHYAKVLCDRLFGVKQFQNEIVWAYQSGGGSRRRYGRKHDTILWYGRGPQPYFDAEAARVPYDAVIARKRAHLFHPRGKVSGDVLAIPRPPNHSEEWVGWPTQKPRALLDWLVRVHSAPGALVGDFFCGSGTTLVSAVAQGRRAFGCDVSKDGLALAERRLRSGIVVKDPPT